MYSSTASMSPFSWTTETKSRCRALLRSELRRSWPMPSSLSKLTSDVRRTRHGGSRGRRCGEGVDHLLAVALELGRADAGDAGQLFERPWPRLRDRVERSIAEDVERGNAVAVCARPPPRLQLAVELRVRLRCRRRRRRVGCLRPGREGVVHDSQQLLAEALDARRPEPRDLRQLRE